MLNFPKHCNKGCYGSDHGQNLRENICPCRKRKLSESKETSENFEITSEKKKILKPHKTYALVTMDEKEQRVYIKSNAVKPIKDLQGNHKPIFVNNFDTSKPAPKLSSNNGAAKRYRHLNLNKFSFFLLQMLKWPTDLSLFFESEREAKLCLRTIFPNPKQLDLEGIKISVKIGPLEKNSQDCESNFSKFDNYPSQTIFDFVKDKTKQGKKAKSPSLSMEGPRNSLKTSDKLKKIIKLA